MPVNYLDASMHAVLANLQEIALALSSMPFRGS
jgi:hypothetical protein